jgi:uncharacterized membrane protein YgdD (TMEM256/DUF423 family)
MDKLMNRHRFSTLLWLFIAMNGALYVGLSAYASHAVELSNSDYLLSIYQKASAQHIVHTVVLLTLAVSRLVIKSRWLMISMMLFAVGIVFFSYTLYLFSFTGVKIAGFLTPIGGVCFIFGWLSLAGLVWQGKRSGEHINE